VNVLTDFPPDLPAAMGVESETREALINLIFGSAFERRVSSLVGSQRVAVIPRGERCEGESAHGPRPLTV
jgi:hypothetical protein